MRVCFRSYGSTIGDMFRRFTITLPGPAAQRLQEIARDERRDPREQAAMILERVLAPRRGRPVQGRVTVRPPAVER